jgi:hypothetical protein
MELSSKSATRFKGFPTGSIGLASLAIRLMLIDCLPVNIARALA